MNEARGDHEAGVDLGSEGVKRGWGEGGESECVLEYWCALRAGDFPSCSLTESD